MNIDANQEMLVSELIHSIFWMIITAHSSYRYRKEIDKGSFNPTLEVSSNSRFSIESDQDDPELIEKFFRKVSTSGICTVGETDYEHRASVELHFDEVSLKDVLLDKNVSTLVDSSLVIEAFLDEAARFEKHFESSEDGRSALKSLPITMDWFSAPNHFVAVLDILAKSKFCEKIQGQYRWLSKTKPHMEAVHLWVDGKTIHQIQEAELSHIWNTMPKRFKAPFLDHAKKVNGLDVLSYASLMGYLWYGDQWHEEPEDMESLRRGDLVGGHISTAKALGKLFKEGKLKL